MEHSDVVTRVIEILGAEFPLLAGVGLAPGTPLVSAGLLDSFAIVTLLVELERAFGVDFDVERMELEQFETPEAIARACAAAMHG